MHISFNTILVTDVDTLREIALRTFAESYEHLNTPSNFKWYIDKAFTKEKLISEIRNKESLYFFAISENVIMGYLKLNIGRSQTEKFSANYLEIERIYLDSHYHGKGHGRSMIDFTFKKARELKKSKIWLGVWDQNPKAIQFYLRIGFQINGEHIFKFGDEDQIDLIMEMNVPSE